jgi:hypothetical protein
MAGRCGLTARVVEAGVNSEEDTKNRKAVNESGRELKEESEDEDGRQ